MKNVQSVENDLINEGSWNRRIHQFNQWI